MPNSDTSVKVCEDPEDVADWLLHHIGVNCCLRISIMPKKTKVQLHLIKVDQNKSKCNICAKGEAATDVNAANLIWDQILISISS